MKGRQAAIRRSSGMLLLGLVLAALGGCCWLAAGAGAGVGYKVGTDERSVGSQVSDASITATIKARLVKEPGIRALNIDVDSVDGHVTLTGIVKNTRQAQRAAEIARGVEGVKSVKNNLRVKP